MSASIDQAEKDRAWGVAFTAWILAAPAAAVTAVISVPGTLLDAWVAQHVWVWLVTPTTHAPVPPFALFVGADMLLTLYAKTRSGSVSRSASEVVRDSAFTVLAWPMAVLVLAWIMAHLIGGAQ